MKLKSITPSLLVTDDLWLAIEKTQEGKHWFVACYLWISPEPKSRMFGSEAEADEFIHYLKTDS